MSRSCVAGGVGWDAAAAGESVHVDGGVRGVAHRVLDGEACVSLLDGDADDCDDERGNGDDEDEDGDGGER